MTSLALQPAVFNILRDLIQERTGLCYRSDDLPLLRDKLSVRVEEAGFDSFLDYYYFLRYDPASSQEMNQLVDHLVVNETYLFRELDGLEQLVRRVLVPRVQASKRARVWSAACATGEECLSLAMLLAREGILEQVEVVGSDISPHALEKARAGHLGRRSLRGEVPPGLEPYLDVGEKGIAVAARIRDAIQWHQVNLVDRKAVAGLGTFDAILCRNVLIYFSDETTREVVTTLAAQLAAQGLLLVGTSESLMRFGTALSCEERGGVFFYKVARG